MSRVIPIRVFEASEVPILAVDTEGTLRYANRATAEFFASTGDLVLGRPCWKITRLRAADGRPFCCRECPIRREARLGRVPATEHVSLAAGDAPPRRFDLLNFLVPSAPGAGCLVLHFLLPGRDDAAQPPACRSRAWPACDRLHRLSPRELQVLEGLAGGLDAVGVADRFAISLHTARNHIRGILHKLKVHRQMDAVLLLLGRTPVLDDRLTSMARRAS